MLLWSREEFGVNLAVRPCLRSFLSHNKHHPFENKVREIYIFIRSEFVRSLKFVNCLIMFPLVFVLRLYNTNTHTNIISNQNQTGDISSQGCSSLKLVDKFIYLGSSVSSTGTDIDTLFAKAWTAIDRLSVIWKSDLTDKMKRSFFQVAVVSILLYGCITWTLNKRVEKKLVSNYTRMLRAILNKSWRQHSTKHQLYGHLPPIPKPFKVRRTRHAGHYWRSRDELISDVLLWTLAHGRANARWLARTYTQQLCDDTRYNPEDLQEAMDDWEEWR